MGNRTVTLHDAQEFDNDLRAGPDEDLTFAGFLGVVDGIERIVQDAGFDHCHGSGGMFGLCSAEEARRESEILNS